MRKYHSKAGSTVRVEYGIDLVEGLKSFPETAPLAEGFEAVNEELDESHENRRRLRKPVLKARAALRIRAFRVDPVIKQYSNAVQIADGGKRGAIYDEQFPDGLGAVVNPAGRKQYAPLIKLIERLTLSRKRGIKELRDTWLPQLQAVADALKSAIDTYEAALDAVLTLFKTELGLRDDHELAVDKLMGEVRALFPRDRATQDAIFPEVTSSSSRDDHEDPLEEITATGDAEPTEPR